MKLESLPKTTENRLKRVGRGHGSGRGKTAGRGTKGQKARGNIKLFFEGGALALVKRMPFLRGRGRNKSIKTRPFIVTLNKLDKLPSGSNVDIDILVKNGFVPQKAKWVGVKILGDGKIKTALKVTVPVSNSAKLKIEKAGGSVLQ